MKMIRYDKNEERTREKNKKKMNRNGYIYLILLIKIGTKIRSKLFGIEPLWL